MAMAAAVEWWRAAEAAIAANTGLSPAAFFTFVAVAAALYVAVSGLLAQPAAPPARRREEEEEVIRTSQPLPPPVQLGAVTEEELRAYDGSDPTRPLLMAIKGQIYDVTQSRMFYGQGGPYEKFAGRDASRALAKMSFDPEDLTGDISGLAPLEVEALNEWEYKFMSKYVKVGTIKNTIPVSDGDAAIHGETSARTIDVGTVESNRVPEPEESGATCHADAMDNSGVKSDADMTTSGHAESDPANASSHEDSVEKPGETTTISAEDAREGKGAADEDEDAVEKLKETSHGEVKSA
ncbi:hypothetical protein GUJ93_ZPchr0024g29063 [Zizania palustris]|uniref:Cytochrome b5 heme-binding domain-containing protein n=1 Tax=Zizania palustris TaxID=103762 RepID=A0A8J5R4Y4_ZIZPA|nr:hypothetical protein GUJ93_ZPchr0024g29063 [Zizania palustris]